MTFASDQKQGTDGLSPTSTLMIKLRDEVLADWETQVRESLPQADTLRHPILMNTLPAFYDNIAQAVTPDYPRVIGTESTSLAAEHGGERARMTAYDHQSLVAEYQMFRWAIFSVLAREKVSLNHQEYLIVNASIDTGIREAVNAFTLVHTGLREKFAAALTHDMRGPLNVAVTALEVSVLTKDAVKSQAMIVKALENLRRMDSMISELLHSMVFAGGRHMQIELSNFDMFELVKEVQIDAMSIHGPRVLVTGKSVQGWWGRAELKRAIENIVANAFKYGISNTPVTIDVKDVHGRILVSVHNQGEPIPVSEQECVFQVYRRAEAAKGSSSNGWGIGLPFVRTVAESHGGSVGLESTPEHGTTFLIDLPVDCRGLENSPTLS